MLDVSGPIVSFVAVVRTIENRLIIQLPTNVSNKLPSRGQVAARVVIDGHSTDTVLEPDGRKGHWLAIDEELRQAIGVQDGEDITVEIRLRSGWPEPKVPRDFQAALNAASPEIQASWHDITPMARWEWVRWINSTNVVDTRARRIEVSIAKLNNGKRRPCCFNLASCTDPTLSRSGKLIDIGV